MYRKYLFIVISLKNIHLVTQSPYNKGQKSSASASDDLHIQTETEKFIGEYGGV